MKTAFTDLFEEYPPSQMERPYSATSGKPELPPDVIELLTELQKHLTQAGYPGKGKGWFLTKLDQLLGPQESREVSPHGSPGVSSATSAG
jgi:hypothetical protein